jgi:hypothetical protein
VQFLVVVEEGINNVSIGFEDILGLAAEIVRSKYDDGILHAG